MFSRLIATNFCVKRIHKINKIFCVHRCYSQNKYRQSENPSPAAIELMKKGEWRDKVTQEDRGQIHRILTGRNTEEDLNIDYRNPVELAHWFNRVAREGPKTMINNPIVPKPITITVTGAAGAIAYSLLPRIARGDMLGENQPVILKLLEVPQAMNALNGVVMELEDLASPLVEKIIATDDPKEAFTGADIAILIGAKPRQKGQERVDVLKDNAKIFAEQGKYLNAYANSEVLVLVVGNPANTNALILSANAPDINPRNITAMTRLDHDRGLGLIAEKAKCYVTDIQRFCVWGNHSSTQYPDVGNTLIRGTWLRKVIQDEEWIYKTFIPTVQQRGAQIIEARGKSSAASAASAAINHIRDWVLGYNEWVSMAIPTDGSQYNIPAGIWCSMPVICTGGGQYDIVNGVEIDIEAAKAINRSINELLEEKEAVKSLLPPPKFRFSFIPSTVFTKKYLANEDVTEELAKELNVKNQVEQ